MQAMIGQRIYPPGRVVAYIRMSPTLKQKVRQRAEELDMSLNEYLVELVERAHGEN